MRDPFLAARLALPVMMNQPSDQILRRPPDKSVPRRRKRDTLACLTIVIERNTSVDPPAVLAPLRYGFDPRGTRAISYFLGTKAGARTLGPIGADLLVRC